MTVVVLGKKKKKAEKYYFLERSVSFTNAAPDQWIYVQVRHFN